MLMSRDNWGGVAYKKDLLLEIKEEIEEAFHSGKITFWDDLVNFLAKKHDLFRGRHHGSFFHAVEECAQHAYADIKEGVVHKNTAPQLKKALEVLEEQMKNRLNSPEERAAYKRIFDIVNEILRDLKHVKKMRYD